MIMSNRKNPNNHSNDHQQTSFDQIITDMDLQHQPPTDSLDIPSGTITIVNAYDDQNTIHTNEDIFQLIIRRLDEIDKKIDDNFAKFEMKLMKKIETLFSNQKALSLHHHQQNMLQHQQRQQQQQQQQQLRQQQQQQQLEQNHHQIIIPPPQQPQLNPIRTRKDILAPLRRQPNGEICQILIKQDIDEMNDDDDENVINDIINNINLNNNNNENDNDDFGGIDHDTITNQHQQQQQEQTSSSTNTRLTNSLRTQQQTNKTKTTAKKTTKKSTTTKNKNNNNNDNTEKRLKCEQCDFSCNYNSSLSRHRRIHLNYFPHPCPYCEFRFRRLDNLKVHMKRKHQDR